jgi:hypothetical protein
VYAQKPRDLNDFRQRIIDACALFDVELCQQICRSVPDRLVYYINQNGYRIEHVVDKR